MRIRVEYSVNFNGQEIRKTAEAETNDDVSISEDFASNLFRSITRHGSSNSDLINPQKSGAPREWWLTGGDFEGSFGFRSKQHALAYYSENKIVHVREVLPSSGESAS